MTGDRGSIDRSPIDREAGVTPTEIRYYECSFTYTGTLAAGEVFEIDTEDFTAINNDSNAIGGFSGDFPQISPGANCLTYSDSESSRTVEITVNRKERRI